MTLSSWLVLTSVCITGAMSPGPSLAVVMRNTMAGGKGQGLSTAWAHAVGVGGYGLLSALGLSAVIVGSPVLFDGIRYSGACFLVVLAYKAMRSKAADFTQDNDSAHSRGARDGLLIAVLNPKIAVWFIALFGQFISPQSTLTEKLGMGLLAMAIDGLWYTIVVFGISWAPLLDMLRRRVVLINRAFGVVLCLVAIRVALPF